MTIEQDNLEMDAIRWRWLVKHSNLGFEGAPSYAAVVRLPVFDVDCNTLEQLVDYGRTFERKIR